MEVPSRTGKVNDKQLASNEFDAFGSGSSGLGSCCGRGHCVVFLDKTLYYNGAFLHPGTQVHKWVLANLMLEGNPAMDWHPIQRVVEILPVASCYINRR